MLIVAVATVAFSYYMTEVREYEQAQLEYTPGTYTVTAKGFHGPITLDVTFTESQLKAIDVVSEEETPDVGHSAIPVVASRIIKAQGLHIDCVTGATITSEAVKEAVRQAAIEANVSDLTAFNKNRSKVRKGEKIKGTWDIVIIGGGGAGLAAAAQAAQDGNTVLIIEKNLELGGNTVVSGGIYQSVTPYLVWDPKDPDAKQGKGYDGMMYDKVKSEDGCINTLRMILDWSEKPFDLDYYKTHKFIAGDEKDLMKHGVHQEYLPTLKALKAEIREYLDWADKQLKSGKKEREITMFSTNNLHIFQTYYGGLRPSLDGKEWCYGKAEMVKQFIEEGQSLKPWLMDMGVNFAETQGLIVGSLWYRGNLMNHTIVMNEGKQDTIFGTKGPYIMAPYCSFINANEENKVMTLTTAKELIINDGRVEGVMAVSDEGAKVYAYARKGVIIATGGYAANISKVVETNKYWSGEYLLPTTKTTNRSSLQGDGIWMAQAIGADVTGMGWTQLLPLAFAQTGNIAFGSVDNAILVSPQNGKRFVDELSERDVLSIKAFEHGIELMGAKGVHLYISGNVLKGHSKGAHTIGDMDMNQYTTNIHELPAILKKVGIKADADTIINTIRKFDLAVINGQPIPDVNKKIISDIIGKVERKADGSYDPKTYDLDNSTFTIRILAPATHHTMGGLRVDLSRHVLDTNGQPIAGLFAAGEVTGGFHGGNRLGGNALTEVMVSGRIAAREANKNK